MKKLFFSLVLIFFVLLSSVRVYGFYQDTKITQLTEVNTHELLTQRLVTDSHKSLVPKGSILGVNDVEEVVFEYQVFVQKDFEMVYKVDQLSLNGKIVDEDLVALFNFEFDQTLIRSDKIQTDVLIGQEDGYLIQVTLTVSMNEPTYEQYQRIANQIIDFDIVFSVE